MDLNEVMLQIGSYLGVGSVGTGVGYYAQKNAAKTEAVKELQLLKSEYKEFADYTKTELLESRKERESCHKLNECLKEEIEKMKQEMNDLTTAMHNVIQTPKPKRKGYNSAKSGQ